MGRGIVSKRIGNAGRHAGRNGLARAATAAALGILLGCCGCAAKSGGNPAATDADPDNDPAEPVNRAIFKANLAADHAVMRPVAQAYVDHVPQTVRQGVGNVVQNFKEPAIAVNDLLQGHVAQAWQSVRRLAVNTTVGVGGIVDIAKKWGLPPHSADFGQTLAVWGVGEGPFVELPLLGPSNPRDALGTAVDLALNPLTFVGGAPATYASVAATGANVVDMPRAAPQGSRRVGTQLARLLCRAAQRLPPASGCRDRRRKGARETQSGTRRHHFSRCQTVIV